MVFKTHPAESARFRHGGLYCWYGDHAEAGSSRARDASEQPSTSLDGNDTDATLVEDAPEDYGYETSPTPAGKGKRRAVSPFILPRSERTPPRKGTVNALSTQLHRSIPDADGICEVTLPGCDFSDEKIAHFSTLLEPEFPVVRAKTFKPLIRPAPNYNLPALNYTVDLRDKSAEPVRAVVEAVAHRRAVIEGITASLKRAHAEQKRELFEQSCLTCRKEGLRCIAKVMRDRQLPCAACIRTETPCRWAEKEEPCGRKRKVPFDMPDDDDSGQEQATECSDTRPMKKRRTTPLASPVERGKKNRRSPI